MNSEFSKLMAWKQKKMARCKDLSDFKNRLVESMSLRLRAAPTRYKAYVTYG